jgi:TetR/AcrR family transcriptional regulator, transcriptional repressor of bet genes
MTHTAQPETRSGRRRREVAEAARRVITRKGLERTTLRDISREGGFTTGVLMHHFPDKQAVIVGTFLSASEDFEAYVRRELAAAHSPEELLQTLVRVSVPDDPERRAEWRLWSEMWTYAGHDRGFAEQLIATDARWEELIADVLERACAAGLLRPDLDARTEAPILARLVDGLGLRAWIGDGWGKARRELVAHLAMLGMPPAMQKDLTHGG